jgi:hypothetical protein
MDNYDVPMGIRQQIISAKIEVLRNSVYDAGLDAKVAKVLGDERGVQVATERVRLLLQAIEMLEAELKELGTAPAG